MHTVCHIVTKLELGGAQQNTLFTVSHLDETKYRPILITGEPGILDSEAEAIPNIELFRVQSLVREIRLWKDCRAFWELTRLLKQLKPSIVHTHSSKAGIIGRLAAWWVKVPIVIHSIHGFGFTPLQRPLVRQMLVWSERIVAKVTTRFFSVSEANRQQGIALKLFPESRCSVIRSGVNLELFRSIRMDVKKKKQELGLDPALPVVGMIAAFKPQKAPLDFVQVASCIYKRGIPVQFVMVGDGEMRADIERAKVQYGLERVLHLLGWRRDVAEIHHCLDVLVLTSLWEGLPRVYVEALASGTPVVGTRVDGAAEVILDGVNGYLLEPGDIQGLAAKVEHVLMHLTRFCNSETERLTREFDIHEMVRQQEEEYQKLLFSQGKVTGLGDHMRHASDLLGRGQQ